MNYKKEIFKRVIFGIPIGIAIGATITLIISIIMESSDVGSSLVSLNYYINGYIASALIGAVFGAASIIWDVEKLSLLAQTASYFFVTITVHLSGAIIARWIPFELWAILLYLGIYIVLFIIIFVIIYNIQRKRVEEVNKALSE